MYIIISIFLSYVLGIISYELNIFPYYFITISFVLISNSLITKKIVYNTVIITFAILSYVNCNYNSKNVLSQHINDNIIIETKIKRQRKSATDSYDALVLSINGRPLSIEENIILYPGESKNIGENSIIRISCNVAENRMNRNKMMFNYKNYLRAKKISASVFTEGDGVLLVEDYSIFNKIAGNFKRYTEKTFYNHLNKDNADIILSIILGDVNYLDDELYDNIKVTGLAHIFAVSGTHIALMYTFLLNVFKYFLSRRSSWILSWSLIWFYGFLIGFPLSIMRALVMFTLLFGSELLYRKYSSLNSIALAALTLTIYNPFWIFDAGFLLSFSAALSFIIFSKYIKIQNKFFKNLYMYIFLQLFTLPVIVYYFNFLPLMGLIYNLLLLPVFTVIIIYGFILLLFKYIIYNSVYLLAFRIFDYILYSLRYIIDLSDKFPFNGFILPTMSPILIIFFYMALFFMIYLHNNQECRCKKYGITALLCFYTINYIFFPLLDNKLYFNIIDVGQGLFTVINYKGINIIYDCGSNSTKEMGQYIAIPYMRKRAINEVEGVFISHWDDDHYSALEDLINSNIKINKIFSSTENESFPQVQILRAGDYMKFEDLTMEILWPYPALNLNSSNNSSLVASISYRGTNILLTGDIEKEAEYAIYNSLNDHDIVLVPHHGSKSSSTEEFVGAVNPKIAIVSYGKNHYGIPHQEVITRYKNAGTKVFSTFDHGEINIVLKDRDIYYNTYTKEKSDNYYELYLHILINNFISFLFLLIWMLKDKEKEYEL